MDSTPARRISKGLQKLKSEKLFSLSSTHDSPNSTLQILNISSTPRI